MASGRGCVSGLESNGAARDCRRALRKGRYDDTRREDARNPRCSGAPDLAQPPGGAVAHGHGVRWARLEGVHAVQVPLLGRAEGGMSVLWECVVWHHPGLSTPPRARPRVSLKVPICVPSVMAPRSLPCSGHTTWRGLTIDASSA